MKRRNCNAVLGKIFKEATFTPVSFENRALTAVLKDWKYLTEKLGYLGIEPPRDRSGTDLWDVVSYLNYQLYKTCSDPPDMDNFDKVKLALFRLSFLGDMENWYDEAIPTKTTYHTVEEMSITVYNNRFYSICLTAYVEDKPVEWIFKELEKTRIVTLASLYRDIEKEFGVKFNIRLQDGLLVADQEIPKSPASFYILNEIKTTPEKSTAKFYTTA